MKAITQEEMRNMNNHDWLGKAIYDLAEQHEEVVALTCDLASSYKFTELHKLGPNRCYNLGIAEQNLIGISAGMASGGLVPFAATFAIFMAMRAVEQVHADVCYPKANVKIIGSHAGLSFAQAGSTHHCTEDIAVMRSLANMTVIVPSDGTQLYKTIQAAYDFKGPMYIRMNRGKDLLAHDTMDYPFEIGKGETLHEGSDLTVIACGSAVPRALQAAKECEKTSGATIRVINMYSIKPIDKELIMTAAKETGKILVVEDHNIIGGLSSAVADVLIDNSLCCSFKRLGVPDLFSIVGGNYEDLLNYYGFGVKGIADTVNKML